MILTNALLSAGFAIVSNFATVVPIPENAIARDLADLRQFTAGDPVSPANVYLVLRNGGTFAIRFGAVALYDAPLNYVHMQDPARIPELLGVPALNSNQVVELAAGAVGRLVKGTNPIARVRPVVKPAGKTREGMDIPFFEVIWPKPAPGPGFGYFAAAEVDARVGQITSLHLADPGFSDYALAQEIRKRTYIPQGPDCWTPITNRSPPATYSMRYPQPTTNEVAQAIASWLWLCAKIGVDPGPDTTLARVNWPNTCIFTNDGTCRVEFKSGVWFLSDRGVAFSHTAPDSCSVYHWPPWTTEQMRALRGTVRYRVADLASGLERKLIENLGIPKEYLLPYVAHYIDPGPIGTQLDNKRKLVLWEHSPDWQYHGVGAEFDVETGRLVDVGIMDHKMFEAIAKAQGR